MNTLFTIVKRFPSLHKHEASQSLPALEMSNPSKQYRPEIVEDNADSGQQSRVPFDIKPNDRAQLNAQLQPHAGGEKTNDKLPVYSEPADEWA